MRKKSNQLTSLNVASETVEMLIFRSSGMQSLYGRVIAEDIAPLEFNRRNGDEKSSRRVIK